MIPKWLRQTILYSYFMAFFMYVTIFKVVPLLHIFLAFDMQHALPKLQLNPHRLHETLLDHFNSHYLFANRHNMCNPPAIFWLSAILSFCIMHDMHLYPKMDILTECYIKEVQSICRNCTMLGSAEANTRLVFGVQIIRTQHYPKAEQQFFSWLAAASTGIM